MRHIKTSYETWTEEDVEIGDTDDKGWHDEEGKSCEPDQWDREDGITAVDLAVKFLKDSGANEASCSSFYPGTWYSACKEDYRTGIHTYYNYHLYEFNEEEQEAIYQRVRNEL